MFSLIRKISNSQQPKDNMEQPARTNDAKDKHEDKQKEEVDGTTYDPGADPRDPGRYYTFPHFAEEEQEEHTTQHSPGTPDNEDEATHQNSGPCDQDSDLPTSDSTTQSTPTPKSTSPSSSSETDQVSPPFWPTSPLSKRLRSKASSPAASSPLPLQRRVTTSSPSSPQLSRAQPCRRTTGSGGTWHRSTSMDKYHSSPAARSLRSISAAQSPSRKEQQQQQQQQQHRRPSGHSQGSPKKDDEKIG